MHALVGNAGLADRRSRLIDARLLKARKLGLGRGGKFDEISFCLVIKNLS
jgi:hypothetical protein